MTASRRAAWIALLAVVACSDDGVAPGAPRDAASPVVSTRAPVAEEPVSSPEPPDLRLPQDGVVVREDGDRLFVFAKGVGRFDVLERLAVRFRFEVVDWDDVDPEVDVLVESATLEEALARLIEPSPFTLRYRDEDREGRSRLALVEIGTAPPAAVVLDEARPDVADGEQRKDGRRARRPEPERRFTLRTDAEHEAAMERRAARAARRYAEALRDLESADPSVRADAVASLDAEDAADRARLLDLALSDPDPDVRTRAVEGLSFGDATVELVAALDDPDPDVVAAALDALSWLDDPDLAGAAAPFRDHPNPAVREAATRFEDYRGEPHR